MYMFGPAMRLLGLDPGLSGAVAVWDTALDALIVRDMPAANKPNSTRREVVPEWLAQLVREWAPDVAWIERVSAMPGQGVSSVFSFGDSFGVARGVLGALQVNTHFVTPAEWKRALRLSSDKSAARAMTARLFSANAGEFARKSDDGRAEAALLTHFGLSRGHGH